MFKKIVILLATATPQPFQYNEYARAVFCQPGKHQSMISICSDIRDDVVWISRHNPAPDYAIRPQTMSVSEVEADLRNVPNVPEGDIGNAMGSTFAEYQSPENGIRRSQLQISLKKV